MWEEYIYSNPVCLGAESLVFQYIRIGSSDSGMQVN